jgi:hypothetical protein
VVSHPWLLRIAKGQHRQHRQRKRTNLMNRTAATYKDKDKELRSSHRAACFRAGLYSTSSTFLSSDIMLFAQAPVENSPCARRNITFTLLRRTSCFTRHFCDCVQPSAYSPPMDSTMLYAFNLRNAYKCFTTPATLRHSGSNTGSGDIFPPASHSGILFSDRQYVSQPASVHVMITHR